MQENTTPSYFILFLHKAHAKPAGKGPTEAVCTHCEHTTLTKTSKEENKMETTIRKERTLTYDPPRKPAVSALPPIKLWVWNTYTLSPQTPHRMFHPERGCLMLLSIAENQNPQKCYMYIGGEGLPMWRNPQTKASVLAHPLLYWSASY